MKRFRILLVLLFALPLAAQTTRVNAGDTSPYTDSHGNVWAADTGFNGGIGVNATTHAITGTNDPTLYQYNRYAGPSGTTSISYTFTLTNGNYQVNLGFAETHYSSSGQRVFNVKINGVQVLTNFDIFAKVGEFAADIESFSTTISGGTLTIEFDNVVTYALISDIEIVAQTAPVSVAVSPSTATVLLGGTSSFTANVTNDPANAGVTWTATYGTVSPTSSSSGAQVTYTAPTKSTSGTDTITAKSVTDTTKTSSATITLTHSVGLQWTDGNNGTGTVTYSVSRASAPCGAQSNYTVLASGIPQVQTGSTTGGSYTDTTPVAGATYCYTVQAVASDGTPSTFGIPTVFVVNVP